MRRVSVLPYQKVKKRTRSHGGPGTLLTKPTPGINWRVLHSCSNTDLNGEAPIELLSLCSQSLPFCLLIAAHILSLSATIRKNGEADSSLWTDRQVEGTSLNRHLSPNRAQTRHGLRDQHGPTCLGLPKLISAISQSIVASVGYGPGALFCTAWFVS